MAKRMKEISREKAVYDFALQITNDFLGLAVIGLKNGVIRNTEGKKSAIEIIKRYCNDEMVVEALQTHTMNQLSITIKVFLMLMKMKQYQICYWICKLFFKS